MDSFQAAIQNMTAEGWAKFGNPGARLQKDMDAQRQIALDEAATIAAPLLTEDGQALLKLLIEKIVLRPSSLPIEGHTLEQQALYAAKRRGENGVVAMLYQAVATVNKTSDIKLPAGDP